MKSKIDLAFDAPCEGNIERILEWLDRAGDLRRDVPLREHLRACRRCREFAETMRPGPIDHGFALWKIYINVDDAQATWKRAVDAGYPSVMEPARLDRWPVVVGFVLDPDGYLIEIIQHDGKRPGE